MGLTYCLAEKEIDFSIRENKWKLIFTMKEVRGLDIPTDKQDMEDLYKHGLCLGINSCSKVDENVTVCIEILKLEKQQYY